jgi:chromosome segregation ATPase
MKNFKDILIYVLLACILVFVYKSCFAPDPLYKEKIKELEERNKELDKKLKSSDSVTTVLKSEYQKLEVEDSLLKIRITALDADIERKKKEAARSQAALSSLQRDLAKTRAKIDSLKKNPPNRTGNDLLNSLKIKTTRP